MGELSDIFVNFIETNMIIVIIASLASIIILLLINIIIMARLNKLNKRYKKLTRGIEKKNLADVVEIYYDKIENEIERVDYLETIVNKIQNDLDKSIQKVSIKRFRAFEDVGSDLSFSIAMLDNKDNGIVISSIYNRNDSTVYAKGIKDGKTKYELSEEEKEVLQDALNQ